MTLLEDALNNTSVPPLHALHFAHVTVAKCMNRIVRSMVLRPSACAAFGRKMLYFSYGVPFYKPGNGPTEDQREWPVAFLFDRSLLNDLERFYPFDTGAVAKGLFGEDWKTILNRDTLYVTRHPERLVSVFYGTNENYVNCQPQALDAPQQPPIPVISEFLSTRFPGSSIDQRQRTIECTTEKAFCLMGSLVWVAYPKFASAQVHALWRKYNGGLDYWAYEPRLREDPGSLVDIIALEARDRFKHLWRRPT